LTTDLSTPELFSRVKAEATNEDGDPDVYWELVSALHDRDPREVWALLSPLAQDQDPRLQQLVPDVLRLLGREAQPLASETLALFSQMLARNPPAEVIACIANACVDFHDGSIVTMLAPHAGHDDETVREGVLHALRRSSHPDAIAALINLSRDTVDELREWATFALGSQLPLVDGPEVRDALARRLTDPHEPTRDEAVIGLGLRADSRALGPLRAQLERGFVGVALFEAAHVLASPSLREALAALEQDPKVQAKLTEEERNLLAAALLACAPAADN
jgi:HEAT repeat protein